MGFFRDLLHHTKGEWAGHPFKLLPWQRTLTERLFGTLLPDGRRQYRRAYVEVPKKQGKSAWAAGIALYLLLGEDEPEAEIYSAAVDREQAAIVFAQARRMVESSPALAQHVEVYRNSIVRPATGGTYRVLSADVPTKHGINASGIIFDELHAHPTRELWDVLTTATAARRQPLTIAITTAGHDRLSIGWEQHAYAEAVLAGTITDPEFLALIYAAHPDDDWTDPATWAKANPSLGYTVRGEYLAAECARAKHSPAYENSFKRYHLNLWTEQLARWMPLDAWARGVTRIEDDELIGLPAYGGLDLGQTDDLSAFVLVFLLPDGRVAVRAWHWLPQAALTAHRHRPYDLWQRAGSLRVTEGNVTDFDVVEADVLARCRQYNVHEVAYDQRFALSLALHLQGEGVTMLDQLQGFYLNEPLQHMMVLAQAGKLLHGGDPLLAWQASNMVVRMGTRGEIRAAKDAAGDKIDGMVALAMALGRAMHAPVGGSAYADHGLLTV